MPRRRGLSAGGVEFSRLPGYADFSRLLGAWTLVQVGLRNGVVCSLSLSLSQSFARTFDDDHDDDNDSDENRVGTSASEDQMSRASLHGCVHRGLKSPLPRCRINPAYPGALS